MGSRLFREAPTGVAGKAARSITLEFPEIKR